MSRSRFAVLRCAAHRSSRLPRRAGPATMAAGTDVGPRWQRPPAEDFSFAALSSLVVPDACETGVLSVPLKTACTAADHQPDKGSPCVVWLRPRVESSPSCHRTTLPAAVYAGSDQNAHGDTPGGYSTPPGPWGESQRAHAPALPP